MSTSEQGLHQVFQVMAQVKAPFQPINHPTNYQVSHKYPKGNMLNVLHEVPETMNILCCQLIDTKQQQIEQVKRNLIEQNFCRTSS